MLIISCSVFGCQLTIDLANLYADLPTPVVVFDQASENKASNENEKFEKSESTGAWTYADQNRPMDVNQAAVVNGLTRDHLKALALASNPSIRRIEALVSASRGRALQVGLKANPNIGFDFEQLGSDGQAEQYGVMIEQEFIRSEKLELNRCVAKQEVGRLQQMLMVQRQQVLTDVEIAFVRVLRAQKQIEVTEDLVELSKKALSVARQLLEAKEVSRADVLQAELEVQSSDILLLNAKNRHVAAWQTLSAVTGQPSLAKETLAGDLFAHTPPIDFLDVLAKIQVQSPEMGVRLAAIEQARYNLNRQRIEPLPNVTVGGLLNWRDNGIGGDADAGITVSIPLPIHDRNQGAICEAQHQLVAAQHELAQLEWQLKQRLAPVYERYRNAKEQSDRYRETILPKAAETLSLTRETYELGEVNFINLLTVQRTYAQTRLAYIESLETLRIAEAEIDGMLLSGSLELP
ncbi:Cobalt-zinc-cadmium resistance protein CzcC precursor [Planctomycetes bacterium CA13]|uniref:Cobalt-zinc-cadmium resistance protein CzcC n=2 Tax=Novipirellula herctigrandis TaxID=2527986 RepID=A0A5C5YNE9_9BACT|nr:Cobalt-zinc-cadmium resistance protein CzcC precursor [Planctomycetes bacterium CA13]